MKAVKYITASMKYLFRVSIFFILISCDRAPKDAKKILMVNNSMQKIIFFESNSYPDTLTFEYDGCAINDFGMTVSRNETKPITFWGYWEDALAEIPSKTRMFFVYNADTCEKYYSMYGFNGCDSLRNRPDLILKRFDVTIDYLNHNDWKLVYP